MKKFTSILLLMLVLYPYAAGLEPIVQVTAQSISNNAVLKPDNKESVVSETESENLTENEVTEIEDDSTIDESQVDEKPVNSDSVQSETPEAETEVEKPQTEVEKPQTEVEKPQTEAKAKPRNVCDTIIASSMNSDLSPGESTQISGELTVNPDPNTDGLIKGDRWETITIKLSDNLRPLDPVSFVNDTILSPNLLAEMYDEETNTITLTIADYYALGKGIVEQFNFYAEFVGASDLEQGKITFTVNSVNGEKCEKDVTLTYHDPNTWNIGKKRIEPAGKYVVVGDEVTYEITGNATGSADAPELIQMIDTLPDGVEIISADGGKVSGNTITWDLTTEEKAAHQAKRTITVRITEEFQAGDQLTNNAEISVDNKVVDSAQVTDTISDSSVIVPGKTQKVAHAGETGVGGSIEPGGEIYWSFEDINVDGVGSLNNYRVIDEFPAQNILHLNQIDFGTYAAPNELVKVEVIYNDENKAPLVIDEITPSGSKVLSFDEGDDVKEVIYYFGTLQLPFNITNNDVPGVHTTVTEDINMITDPNTGEIIDNIENNARFEFDIELEEGQGEGEFTCPPPYQVKPDADPNDNKITCSADGGDTIDVAPTPALAGIEKKITSQGPYYKGDIVDYQVEVFTNKKSSSAINLTNFTDLIPSGEEYVDGTFSINKVGSSDTINYNVNNVTPLQIEFAQNIKLEPGERVIFTYQARVTNTTSEQHINKAYVNLIEDVTSNGIGQIVQEPSDFNGNGQTDKVLYDYATHRTNPITVTTDKTIEGYNRDFLPETVVDSNGKPVSGESVVPYVITITNDNQSGVISNPQIVDTLPNVVSYIPASEEYTTNLSANPPVVTGNANDNNSAQKVVFQFNGDLNPGESIQIKFDAKINDYAQFGRFTNNVELIKDPNAFYTDDSVFSDKISATVTGIAGQSIKKEVNYHYTEAGEAVTYTIMMNNTGTYNLSGLTLKDDVPRSDDDRIDPDKSTVPTEIVDTKLIGLPIAMIDGEPVDSTEIEYEISYIDDTGAEHMETVDTGRLNEIQLTYGADSIKQLRMNGNNYIFNPGTEIVIRYVVEVPNDAQGDAEFYNNASLTSKVLNESNVSIRNITSTSATVETIIKGSNPDTYKIGDFAYYDYNHNDTYDSLVDKPVDGLTVELYMDDNFDGTYDPNTGKIIAYSLTDATGNYLFPDLEPGDYKVDVNNKLLEQYVKVSPANGYEFSTSDKTIFPDTSTGDKGPNFNYNMDFALQYGSVEGMYFYDGNYNDIVDGNDKSITNVTPGINDTRLEVSLERKSGGSYVEIDRMTTTNGHYKFDTLSAGEYRVRAQYKDNTGPYVYTTAKVLKFTISPGQEIIDKDFGLVEPAEIKGTIWDDFDMQKDLDEAGIKDIEINLYRGSSSKAYQTQSTNSAGNFDFDRLVPGKYRLTYAKGANNGYVNGGDSDFTDGETIIFEIKPKEVANYDGGLFTYAKISGNYYEDVNYDYSKNSGDRSVTNQKIQLLDENYNEIASVQTNSQGNYQFNQVLPRENYKLAFSKPSSAEYIDGYRTTDTVIDQGGGINIAKTEIVPGTVISEQNGSLVYKSKISGIAFEDMNGDDLNNGSTYKNDGVLAGINVTLFNKDNQKIGEVTTDSAGYYEFNDLYPGDYHVEFSAKSDYSRSQKDQGNNDAIDSDVNQTGISDKITLKSNDGGKVIDAGYYQNANIKGIAYEDKNTDGKYNSGDGLLTNVTANLYLNGTSVATTVTDSAGAYAFNDVKPGNYQVRFTENTGLYPTKKGSANVVGDSDIDSTGKTASVLVVSGTTDDRNFDGGYIVPASISGTVFYETEPTEDLMATYDKDIDPVMDNVKLTLIDLSTGQEIMSTVSASDGTYAFNNLMPGNYQVISSDVLGYDKLTVAGGIDASGKSEPITLAYGANVTKVDNGLFSENLIIGDVVWEDTNMNGLQELSVEPGIAGVKVELYDDEDNFIAETTTDEHGHYAFVIENPGTYYFKVITPQGYKITKANNESAGEEYDSDLNENGLTNETFIDDNENYHDFGFIALSSVSGNVYRDLNGDGSFNTNDRPLKDQEVKLINSATKAVVTTYTDANGNYKFNGLTPGDYEVDFGELSTQGNWTEESDGKLIISSTNAKRQVKVGYDVDIKDENAGYENNSLIAGHVYEDIEGEGRYNAISDNLLENIEVSLIDKTNSNQIVATTNTNAFGYYEFNFENPDNHEYQIEFKIAGVQVSTKATADTEYDNDTNADLTTGVKKITDGEINKVSFDAAIYTPISLGGITYQDIIYSGTFDEGDEYLKDVEVTLILNGDEVATTITDANGNYQFVNLAPGNYQVKFAPKAGENFSKSGTKNTAKDNDADKNGYTGEYKLTSGMTNYVSYDAAYYVPSQINGTIFYETKPFYNLYSFYDPNEDEELANIEMILYDKNGQELTRTATNEAGYYEFTNLEPSTYFVKAAFIWGKHYLTYPGGIHPDRKTNLIDLVYGQIEDNVNGGVFNDYLYMGDTVFEDENANGIFDQGEKTIAGVEVRLYENKNLIQTTTTDNNGKYKFKVDKVDLYQVEVVAPEGYRFTTQNVGTDETVDSDVNVDGITTVERYYADNYDLDAGLVNLGSISGNVYRDLNENGSLEATDFNTESHEVTLYNLDTNEELVTNTDENGYYLFNDLEAGKYEIRFTSSPIGKWHEASDNELVISSENEAVRTVELEINQDLKNQNAGYTDNTIISGHIYENINGTGIYDQENDQMLEGVEVELLIDGEVSKTTTTDASGAFTFRVEIVGDHTYATRVKLPTGFDYFSEQVANSTIYDNDANENGLTNDVLVSNGTENNVDFDTAVYQSVSLGGTVFEDANYDGELTAGENPVDTTVKLLLAGEVITETKTNGEGKYEFTNLKPGTYQVQVIGSENNVFSSPGSIHTQTGSDVDENGFSPEVTLVSGDVNYVDYDAGTYQLSTISGYVYRDVNKDQNRNQEDKATINHEVTLINQETNEELKVQTDTQGYYEFKALKSGTYQLNFNTPELGNWIENSDNELIITEDTATRNVNLEYATDIVNQDAGYVVSTFISGYAYENIKADGIYNQTTDKMLKDVEVILYENNQELARTTTDSDGYYEFNIDPVTSKEYYVQFKADNKYLAATPQNNHVSYDNDMNEEFMTKKVKVTSEVDNQVDFDGAFYVPAAIGGYIYNDLNENSQKNKTEKFLSGVEISLYQENKLIKTTKTDINGFYEFTNLKPGKYIIEINHEEYLVSKISASEDNYGSDFDPKTFKITKELISGEEDYIDFDGGLSIEIDEEDNGNNNNNNNGNNNNDNNNQVDNDKEDKDNNIIIDILENTGKTYVIRYILSGLILIIVIVLIRRRYYSSK